MEQMNKIICLPTSKLNLPRLCEKFINNPPSAFGELGTEHRMLSERVALQVIVPLDGVERGGEDGPRSRRKDVVREVMEVLGRMDDVTPLRR